MKRLGGYGLICEFESCQVDKKGTAVPRERVAQDGPCWRGWKVEKGQRPWPQGPPNLMISSCPLVRGQGG